MVAKQRSTATKKWQNYLERWFPEPEAVSNHPAHIAWHNSKSQYNIAAAGRRSWKTERAKRKLIRGTPHHHGALTLPYGNFGFFAPTHSQVKRIAWNDLKTMTQPFWAGKPSETELIIELVTGSRIFCVGMDVPERVEGMQWHGIVLDEYANMKEIVWGAHVQPVTSDTGAWVDFIGVPEGRNHYYKLAKLAEQDTTGLWSFFTWKSSDILPPESIQQARLSLDSRLFAQEYEAEFLQGGRVVYTAFSNANIVSGINFDPNAETYLCFDFNATEKPFSVAAIQRQPNDTFVVAHEFSYTYTQTETMCGIIVTFLRENNFNGVLHVCGDASGRSIRTTSSRSDYKIIEDVVGSAYRIVGLSKRRVRAIRDRVNSTNALYCSAAGVRRLYVSEKCKKTITDIQETEWRENGVEIDGSNPAISHLSDAVSYFAHNYFPIDRGENKVW
jgi:hypothetical protein